MSLLYSLYKKLILTQQVLYKYLLIITNLLVRCLKLVRKSKGLSYLLMVTLNNKVIIIDQGCYT